MEATKAITFSLLPFSASKRERLEKLADNFIQIYNEASIRLPSFQSVKKIRTRNACEQLRKDLKGKTELHSQIAQEAIEYARANYQTILSSGDRTKPILQAKIIRIHNQIWNFQKHNNRNYVVIPAEKNGSRFRLLWLPIKNSGYYEEILKTNKKFGVGQINLKNNTFTTSIRVPKEKLSYKPDNFIGIDLGLNNLATLAVSDGKKIKFVKFWDGKQNRHIRNRFNKYRAEVQKIKRLDLVKRNKGFESRWMQYVNHNISKEIINIALKFEKPIIMMENLHKFTNLKWNFFQLRNMIIYKADLNGIKTKLINPKNTSITCNKCGHIEKKNRNGLNFKCLKCGYHVNADLNAAINICNIN